MDQVLDSVDLRGRVKALKEWHEGYEELEAIPNSFAIEFKDGQGSWSMFSDSEEEKVNLFHCRSREDHRRLRQPPKVKILGLLYQATGLKPN
jgi:hypothetical protein